MANLTFPVNFNFNFVQRALVLEDYAPTLGVGGGLLVGKRVQEVWEKKRKKGGGNKKSTGKIKMKTKEKNKHKK